MKKTGEMIAVLKTHLRRVAVMCRRGNCRAAAGPAHRQAAETTPNIRWKIQNIYKVNTQVAMLMVIIMLF